MEFLKDRGHVVLDRFFLKVEVDCDLLVAATLRHEPQDILFAFRERVDL